jgi:Universal stress protein family
VEACQRIRASFPSWTVNAEARGESPAWAILRRADEWKSDLIVVGSHGRSAVGRLILGSVSQKVATEANCSVRVARGPALRTHVPVRILIGVDGSPGAEATVNAVAGREWPDGGEARVVAALDAMMATSTAWREGVALKTQMQMYNYRNAHKAERARCDTPAVSPHRSPLTFHLKTPSFITAAPRPRVVDLSKPQVFVLSWIRDEIRVERHFTSPASCRA